MLCDALVLSVFCDSLVFIDSVDELKQFIIFSETADKEASYSNYAFIPLSAP